MYGKPKNYQLSEAKIISEPELKKLIKELQNQKDISIKSGKQLHYITDYYLILIGSLTGLRVSEVCGLRLSMVQENNLEIVGKRDKKRLVPIGSKCRKALNEYIEIKKTIFDHPTTKQSYLFLSKRRKAYSRHGINKRLSYWCNRISIKHYSFHSLRHRFATYCLNSGFNLAEVQKFLGHSSITVTSQYLHMTQDTVDKVNKLL